MENKYPEDKKYTEEHEWIKVMEDAALVGITWYAQDALGDIVYLDLPEPGTEIKMGDECGEIESVKSVSNIYCPVDGTITETNSKVIDSPEIINEDPYEKGWIFKLKLKDKDQLEKLMNAKEYKDYIKEV